MKRLALATGVIVIIAVVGVLLAGTALAQTATPPAQGTPTTPTQPNGEKLGKGFGFGLGGFGGDWTEFDAVAAALKLTPTQLFEQLHSGKSLSDIASAQGVDMQTIQTTLQSARTQALKDRIAQAVKDGQITQEVGS